MKTTVLKIPAEPLTNVRKFKFFTDTDFRYNSLSDEEEAGGGVMFTMTSFDASDATTRLDVNVSLLNHCSL